VPKKPSTPRAGGHTRREMYKGDGSRNWKAIDVGNVDMSWFARSISPNIRGRMKKSHKRMLSRDNVEGRSGSHTECMHGGLPAVEAWVILSACW
jgi:hypothetical protein